MLHCSFLIQLGNDVLPARAIRNYPKGIPYDYGCPSIQEILTKRICKCGLYTATVVSLNKHQKFCKKGEKELPLKVRPVRLAARRQRELMCVIKNMDVTEFEWYDEDDIDITGLQEPPRAKVVGGTPVIPVDERTPVWEDIE